MIERRTTWPSLRATLVGAVTASVLASCATEHERQSEAAADLAEQQALATGIDAYVYGYPLVTMEMPRRVATNVAVAEERRAPTAQGYLGACSRP